MGSPACPSRTIDPLGGYRKAVQVLGRLIPEANPWAYYHRTGTYEDLLREMFELLGMIILAGVLLTQVSRVRPIAEVELKALEEEERYFLSTLEQWMPVVARSSSKPEIEFEFIDTYTTEDAEPDRESERVGESGDRERASEEQVRSDEVSIHAMIVSNLERMQTDLADLLTRWRESPPRRIEDEGEKFGWQPGKLYSDYGWFPRRSWGRRSASREDGRHHVIVREISERRGISRAVDVHIDVTSNCNGHPLRPAAPPLRRSGNRHDGASVPPAAPNAVAVRPWFSISSRAGRGRRI